MLDETIWHVAAVSDSEDTDPESEFFNNVIEEEDWAAVGELSDKYREPVVSCDVEGLSYAEVAKVMEIPLRTVKSRISRARDILQRKLRAYAVEMGHPYI